MSKSSTRPLIVVNHSLANGGTDPAKASFTLNGVTLYGKFEVKFSDRKWTMQHFQFEETRVSKKNIGKLQDAAASMSKVPIELGNGNGQARITYIEYDPRDQKLRAIGLTLLEWHS
jgi:hypothetical protein